MYTKRCDILCGRPCCFLEDVQTIEYLNVYNTAFKTNLSYTYFGGEEGKETSIHTI